MMFAFAADETPRATAERFLRLLHETGECFEVRSRDCPVTKGRSYTGTASGYFTDPAKAVDKVMALEDKAPPAIWTTVNPVTLEAGLRAKDRIEPKAREGASTSGDDIVRRRWLYLDVDAVTYASNGKVVKNISATDAEMGAAVRLAQRVADDLAATGWPAPRIRTMSGNGSALFYPIDLPNDKESDGLIDRIYKALGAKYDNKQAHVDPSVKDANRLTKIIGTTARKGDHSGDRPHRRSFFLEINEGSGIVSREQLEAVAVPKAAAASVSRPAPSPAPVRAGSMKQATTASALFSAAKEGLDKFDKIDQPTTPASVRAYLERHGVSVKNIRSKGSDGILDLAECPITGASGGTSVSVIVGSDGKISYPNRHNRGDGLTWDDLREHLEPGRKAAVQEYQAAWAQYEAVKGKSTTTRTTCATASPAAIQAGEVGEANELPKLAVKRAADLMHRTFAPLKWIIPDILPEGYGVLAGRPKLGKSYLALDFCVAVAAGGYALGERKCECRRVLYCGLEDGERRLQKRMIEVSGQNQIPELLDYLAANDLPRLHKGGLEALDAHLSARSDTGLVVIDTYAKVRPPKQANADPYQHDYDNGAALADLARKHGVCILAVLHARKAQSEDFIDEITGTLGIAGAADVIMVMRRARGSQDVAFHITGKDVAEQGISLRCNWETKAWTITGDLEAVQHTREVREILDVMKGGDEFKPSQIAELVGDKTDNVTHRLRKMLKSGVAGFEQSRYGKYRYKQSDHSFSSFCHSVQSAQSREVNSEHSDSECRDAKSEQVGIEEGVL